MLFRSAAFATIAIMKGTESKGTESKGADDTTDGSGDGLDSIRAIVAGAAAHLNPDGRVLIEHGYDQAEAVSALLAGAGFTDIVSLPDLAGIPRVAGGKIAPSPQPSPRGEGADVGQGFTKFKER